MIGNTEDLRSDIIRYTRLLRRLDERIEFHLLCLKYITEEREEELYRMRVFSSSLSSSEYLDVRDHSTKEVSHESEHTNIRFQLVGPALPRRSEEPEEAARPSVHWKRERDPPGRMKCDQRRRLEEPWKREGEECRAQYREHREVWSHRKAVRRRHISAIASALKESVDVVHASWQDEGMLTLQLPCVPELEEIALEKRKERRDNEQLKKAHPTRILEEPSSSSPVTSVTFPMNPNKHFETELRSEQRDDKKEEHGYEGNLKAMFKPHEMLIRRFLDEKSWLLRELVEVSKQLHQIVFQKWSSLSGN